MEGTGIGPIGFMQISKPIHLVQIVNMKSCLHQLQKSRENPLHAHVINPMFTFYAYPQHQYRGTAATSGADDSSCIHPHSENSTEENPQTSTVLNPQR
jgi:hypothetical protein